MRDITVHVEFVDVQTGRLFAQTQAPLSMLPPSFDAATRVEIGIDQWEVVSADPRTADRIAQSRKVVLTVRRVQEAIAALGDILYSLPTICDSIPIVAIGTSKHNKRVLELHEDDWRQVELVSRDHHVAIEAELRNIRAIYEQTPRGHGFRKLHLRQRITQPLQVPLSAVLSAFPGAQAFDGIAYEQATGLIEGGFALDTGQGVLYGEQHREHVAAPLSHGGAHGQARRHLGKQLTDLMEAYGLLLVVWCRCAAFDAKALHNHWTRERDE